MRPWRAKYAAPWRRRAVAGRGRHGKLETHVSSIRGARALREARLRQQPRLFRRRNRQSAGKKHKILHVLTSRNLFFTTRFSRIISFEYTVGDSAKIGDYSHIYTTSMQPPPGPHGACDVDTDAKQDEAKPPPVGAPAAPDANPVAQHGALSVALYLYTCEEMRKIGAALPIEIRNQFSEASSNHRFDLARGLNLLKHLYTTHPAILQSIPVSILPPPMVVCAVFYKTFLENITHRDIQGRP
eukprot:gnl/Chilomastix_cuspidata/6893.p1 GENE.gnl/Chilomastix_cuspidata/6893~~gnl/Chilomastix_cuspidata/6893.p1  ORF type:complete len:242 (+),score=2.13 gnl/Chilomastix_cuspidata/6893:319-1044(+)